MTTSDKFVLGWFLIAFAFIVLTASVRCCQIHQRAVERVGVSR